MVIRLNSEYKPSKKNELDLMLGIQFQTKNKLLKPRPFLVELTNVNLELTLKIKT